MSLREKILLEGKDIREINREQLRGRMAMVLQENLVVLRDNYG